MIMVMITIQTQSAVVSLFFFIEGVLTYVQSYFQPNENIIIFEICLIKRKRTKFVRQ